MTSEAVRGCQRPNLKICKLEIFLSPNLFGHPVVKRKFNGQLVAIILNRMGITEWQLRHEVKGRWKSQLTLTVISRLMHLHLSSIQVYFRLILNSKIIGVTCGFFKGLLISNDHDTFPLSLNQVYYQSRSSCSGIPKISLHRYFTFWNSQ